MNKQDALKCLTDMKAVLDKCQMRFWLTDGTLLGHVREQDFIKRDEDIDIGVFAEEWKPGVLEAIIENGFAWRHRFGKLERGLELSFRKYNIKIDIFFFYKSEADGKFWHASWFSYTNKSNEPMRMIRFAYEPFTLVPATFKGLDVLVPEQAEQYVECKYGPQWRVPFKGGWWDWIRGPQNSKVTEVLDDWERNPSVENNVEIQ